MRRSLVRSVATTNIASTTQTTLRLFAGQAKTNTTAQKLNSSALLSTLSITETETISLNGCTFGVGNELHPSQLKRDECAWWKNKNANERWVESGDLPSCVEWCGTLTTTCLATWKVQSYLAAPLCLRNANIYIHLYIYLFKVYWIFYTFTALFLNFVLPHCLKGTQFYTQAVLFVSEDACAFVKRCKSMETTHQCAFTHTCMHIYLYKATPSLYTFIRLYLITAVM